MLSAGLIDKWVEDFLQYADVCNRHPSADAKKGFQPLQLENFFGCFILLGFGLIMALLAFTFEVLLHLI